MTVLLIVAVAVGIVAAAWGALKGDVQAVGFGVVLVGLVVLSQLLPG